MSPPTGPVSDVPVDWQDTQLLMAADRTILALERTYAAWVRTGLAALASGVAAPAFVSAAVSPVIASIMASLLIAFSGFCFVAAVWRDIGHPTSTAASDLRAMPPRLMIGANAMMIAISIMALAGVWLHS